MILMKRYQAQAITGESGAERNLCPHSAEFESKMTHNDKCIISAVHVRLNQRTNEATALLCDERFFNLLSASLKDRILPLAASYYERARSKRTSKIHYETKNLNEAHLCLS